MARRFSKTAAIKAGKNSVVAAPRGPVVAPGGAMPLLGGILLSVLGGCTVWFSSESARPQPVFFGLGLLAAALGVAGISYYFVKWEEL